MQLVGISHQGVLGSSPARHLSPQQVDKQARGQGAEMPLIESARRPAKAAPAQAIRPEQGVGSSAHRAQEPGSAARGTPISGQAAHRPEAPGISQEELQMLRELRARDREVRAHERAHASAGGAYVQSGPDFSYQRGPDGRLYAIGGEVDMDTSKVPGDPQATLDKAQTIKRAALAPAQPSAQDRAVAAQAAAMAQEARQELAAQRNEEAQAANEARAAGRYQALDASPRTGERLNVSV